MGNANAGPETYRVFAVKYAEREARRPEHFLGGDPHDVPMPMDYFVWAVVGPDRTWVIDTGLDSMIHYLTAASSIRRACSK